MEFIINCEKIDLDNSEIGVSVTFRAKDNFKIKDTETNVRKIIDSMGTYLLIQRCYGEDDDEGYYEADYVYLESNIEELCEEWGAFKMIMSREKLFLNDQINTVEIHYKLDDKTFEELKEILTIIDQDSEFIKFV